MHHTNCWYRSTAGLMLMLRWLIIMLCSCSCSSYFVRSTHQAGALLLPIYTCTTITRTVNYTYQVSSRTVSILVLVVLSFCHKKYKYRYILQPSLRRLQLYRTIEVVWCHEGPEDCARHLHAASFWVAASVLHVDANAQCACPHVPRQ